MIPKIIHTFWGGNENIRDKSFLDNWEEVLIPSGYEIKIWKPEDFKDDDTPFLRKSLDNGFWAHASDYVRFKALNEYGGFWLDTDVQVFKPFDRLLAGDYIIAAPNHGNAEDKTSFNCFIPNRYPSFCLSCFGFEKGHVLLDRVLMLYRNASYEIGGQHFRNMDVSTFLKKTLDAFRFDIVYHQDIDDVDKLYDNIKSLTTFDGKTVNVLPACFFDYSYTDTPIHELMYASHKNWATWIQNYFEKAEIVDKTNMFVNRLVDEVLYILRLSGGVTLERNVIDEVRCGITNILKEGLDDKMDFKLL